MKMKNARLHLALIVFGALCLGIGLGAELWGIRGGLGFWTCCTIYVSGFSIWMVVAFTSLQKVKDILEIGAKPTTVDNEEEH